MAPHFWKRIESLQNFINLLTNKKHDQELEEIQRTNTNLQDTICKHWKNISEGELLPTNTIYTACAVSRKLSNDLIIPCYLHHVELNEKGFLQYSLKNPQTSLEYCYPNLSQIQINYKFWIQEDPGTNHIWTSLAKWGTSFGVENGKSLNTYEHRLIFSNAVLKCTTKRELLYVLQFLTKLAKGNSNSFEIINWVTKVDKLGMLQ